MSHLWIRDEAGEWAVFYLHADEYALEPLLHWSKPIVQGKSDVSIVRSQDSGGYQWHLLATNRVRVSINGLPLITGLRTLRERDQITVAKRSAFFSTEERAESVSFPESERKLFCGRCRQELVTGAMAVKCPQCNVWHHQTEELPCWTYATRCSLCSQLTALETGFRWQPED